MTKDELKIKYPDEKFGQGDLSVYVERKFSQPDKKEVNAFGYYDADYSPEAQVIDEGWNIHLAHSCDDWEIGNQQDATELIINLKNAVDYCVKNP